MSEISAMMPSVAVYVLTHDGVRDDWLRDALSSIDESVTVVMIRDSRGHIGQARAMAMGCCKSHEFTAFVDSDDLLMPGALRAAVAGLQREPEAAMAYTLEQRIDEHGTVIGEAPSEKQIARSMHTMGPRRFAFHHAHHVCIYRNALVAPYVADMAHYPVMAEQVFHAQILRRHPAVFVSTVGYRWRQHGAQTSRHIRQADRERAVAVLTPMLRELARVQ